MGATRMLAGSDLRRRWLATLATTLLIGIVGAIVLASVAGARRSDSSLRRFNATARTSDLEINIGKVGPEEVRAYEEATGARVGAIRAFALSPVERTDSSMGAAIDTSFGNVVDRARIVKGRLPDPNVADETAVSETFSKQAKIGVGATLDVAYLTQKQVDRGDFLPTPKQRLKFRVVGLVRRPGDLSDIGASGGVIALTPAFDRKYVDEIAWFTLVVRVRTNGDPAPARDLARKMFGGDKDNFVITEIAAESGGGQSAINVLTVATLLFAAVAALAGGFAIGVVIFRDMARNRPRQSMLRAMGMTRSNRINANVPRAMIMAIGGAVVAVVVAIALSPVFPFGVARRADPDPGLHADWSVLLVGGAVVALFVLGVALIAAARAARVNVGPAPVRSHRSLADVVAVSRLRPTAANGIGMALDPGQDVRAVPLRSAFLGAVVGVLGVTAVLVFVSSLDTLVDHPRRYGATWDVQASVPSDKKGTVCNHDTAGVEGIRGVTDVGALCFTDGAVEGRQTVVWGFTEVRGSIEPTIVSGRAPTADDEVALGRDTMDAAHVHIGGRVNLEAGLGIQPFRVIGEAVFPQMKYGAVQHLADGGAMTGAGFARAVVPDKDESQATNRYLVARLEPGTNADRVERDIRALPIFVKAAAESPYPDIVNEAIGRPTLPPEVDRVRHVAWFGPMLAILMSVLALIAVAHALITATRRRRHDLAILKAIGFNRHQVRATLAWEATTLAVVGLVIGIPAGIIVGRLAWAVVARDLGIATSAALPGLALLVLVPATLLVVNAVAYLPARAASRTRTSIALATE